MSKNKELYNLPLNKEYILELKKDITKGEKRSILSDTMFKTMFQNEKRIKYSAKFISYFINMSYEKILKNIILTKNELDKEKENTKGQRCDYVAKIKDMLINIEVNNNSDETTMERNFEYLNKLYSSTIKVGQKYNYSKVVQINLNNFSFKGNDKIIDRYYIQNNRRLKLVRKIEIINIYIPNLRKKMYTKDNKRLTNKEKYILTLVETNIEKIRKMGVDKIMNEYIEEAEAVSFEDMNFGESYDKEWALQDQAFRNGREEERKILIKTMLKKKIDINLIAECTGMPIEIIKNL